MANGEANCGRLSRGPTADANDDGKRRSRFAIALRSRSSPAPSAPVVSPRSLPFALESSRMASRQFFLIRFGDLRERKTQRVCRYGEAPEHVAKLFDHSRRVDVALLKGVLPHQPENLGGLLGESRAGVEQAVPVVERRVDRAQGGALVVVQVHGYE